jgi:uncharacterized protein YoxC
MNLVPKETSIADFEYNLTAANELLDKSCSFFENLDGSVNNLGKILISLKDADYKLSQLNASLEQSLKNYDLKIEKVKMSSSVLKAQIEFTSSKIDLLLDKILNLNDMDDVNTINTRTQLFEIIKNLSETNANIFITFLTI